MKKVLKSIVCFVLCICMLMPTAAFISSAASLGQVKGLKVKERKSTSITLKWDKVSGAKGYRVYVYNSAKDKWVFEKRTSKTTCKIEDLTSAKNYKFKVKAYKGSDKKVYGKYSKTLSTATLPKKVKNLVATNINTDNLKLKWDSVKRATGYKIYVFDSNSSSWKFVGSTNSTDSKIMGIVAGKTYKFKVRAFYDNGSKTFSGAYSSILTTAAKPNKVTGLKLSDATEDTVTLTWNEVNGATNYQVYKYVNDSWAKLNTTSGAKVTLSATKTAEKYKVRAIVVLADTTVYGDFSSAISASTTGASIDPKDLKAPTNLKGTADSKNKRVKLSWTAAEGATGYQIEAYDIATGSYKLVATTTKTEYNYAVSATGSYHFKVRSYIVSGSNTYYSDYTASIAVEYTAPGSADDTSLSALERYGILGYMYDANAKCFYNTVDPPHRVVGFTPIYDTFAPFAICFYDTVRLDFTYGKLDWRIQLWKGQYGWCFIGGEAGVYTKTSGINNTEFYSCASDENMLPMSMVMYHNGSKIFTRPYGNYWWCTGYIVGVIPGAVVGRVIGDADTSSLKMILRVTLRDEQMRDLFIEGMKTAGFVQGQSYFNDDNCKKAYIYVGNDVFLKWI